MPNLRSKSVRAGTPGKGVTYASRDAGGSGASREDAARTDGESNSEERLWSNLKETEAGELLRDRGSMLGAISLVGGTTVGAGVLALPAETQPAGFVASSVAVVGCWAYMVVTGLLLAEVNANTLCELGQGGVSLSSMSERTLGTLGKNVSSLCYVLLHYCLLVAYISRAGGLTAEWLGLPPTAGLSLFVLLGGGIVWATSPRQLDTINTSLCAGLLASFAVLLENLNQANWAEVPGSLPVIALAFVYHNIVPVIVTSLEGDMKRVRTALATGTAIPMGMFLLWNAVILGQLTPGTPAGDPLQLLRTTDPTIGPWIEAFSLLAITTSFIGFVLGLTDFVADYLDLPTGKRAPLPWVVTLVPPLVAAVYYRDIFLAALEFAGVFGVLVLFGVLPGAMAWNSRYRLAPITLGQPQAPMLVPGGKVTLLVVMGASSAVILADVVHRIIG